MNIPSYLRGNTGKEKIIIVQDLLNIISESDGELDWCSITDLVSADRNLSRQILDDEGRLLLHYACWRHASSNDTIRIMNYYPDAIFRKDNTGQYPNSPSKYCHDETLVSFQLHFNFDGMLVMLR